MLLRPQTLKGKLILYVTLVATVPAIAAVLYYTYDERRMHDQIVIQDTANDLSYMMRAVEERLRSAGQLCDWTFFNRTIQKLVRPRGTLEDLAFTQELIRFQESMDDLLMSSSVGPYVSTLLVDALRGYSIAGDEHVLLADSEGTIICSSGPAATGTAAASL